MFLIYNSISLSSVLIFSITCNLVSSDDIPAILWNINKNALSITSVPALGHNDKIFDEKLKDVHLQESNILVFAVNKLSLEDFSSEKPATLNSTLYNIETFLDIQPHMLLPSVKDPLNYIHKAHCGVQEIVVDNKIDESILHSISSALQRSCVVILHISDDGIITSESELKSVFLPSFENSNKNIVGIFTGVKSSWGSPNNDRHIFRNLLQAPASDDNFLNFNDCIIMYAKDAVLKIDNGANGSLPFPPRLDGSVCGGDNGTSILQLTFKKTESLSSVIIKFEFPYARGSWKTVATLNTMGDKDLNIELESDFIEAPKKFSFSCGNLVLKEKNGTENVIVTFKRFQIQPYQVKDSFSDSFDCVTFFTIPIWMGIIVSILCIAITNCGIYALFSVRTMDRFDDPKGKTISVAATAD